MDHELQLDSDGSNILPKTETCIISNNSLDLPTDLIENKSILNHVLSLNTWQHILNESQRKHLMKFLPSFPQDDLKEKQNTLRLIFSDEPLYFGNPVKHFHEKLKGGMFSPDIARYASLYNKAKIRDYQYQQQIHYTNLVKELVLTRQNVLEHLHRFPFEEPIKLEKIRPVSKDYYKKKAHQRYLKVLKEIDVECGGYSTSSEDENSSSDDNNLEKNGYKVSSKYLTNGDISDSSQTRCYKFVEEDLNDLIRRHRKRRSANDNSADLETSFINLSDVVCRVNANKKSKLNLSFDSHTSRNGEKYINNEQDDSYFIAENKQFITNMPYDENAMDGANDQCENEGSDSDRESLFRPPSSLSCFFSLLKEIMANKAMNSYEIEKKINERQQIEYRLNSSPGHWMNLSSDWSELVSSALNYLSGYGELMDGAFTHFNSSGENDNTFSHKAFVECHEKSNGQFWKWVYCELDNDEDLLHLFYHWFETRYSALNSNINGSMHQNDSLVRDSTAPPIPPPRQWTHYVVKPSSDEDKVVFREQESLRYEYPDRPFTYSQHGYDSIVGPIRSLFKESSSKDNFALIDLRPSCLTFDVIVYDALARLPNGEGTRNDILELLKDSQYLSTKITESQLMNVLIGTLDRIRNEKDPLAKFDSTSRLWIYVYRNKSEEELGKLYSDDASRSSKKILQKSKVVKKSRDTSSLSTVKLMSSSAATSESIFFNKSISNQTASPIIMQNQPINNFSQTAASSKTIQQFPANTQSIIHANTQSIIHSNTQSIIHANTQSIIHPNTQSIIHANTQSIIHPNTQSIIHANTQSIIHPNTQSIIHDGKQQLLHNNKPISMTLLQQIQDSAKMTKKLSTQAKTSSLTLLQQSSDPTKMSLTNTKPIIQQGKSLPLTFISQIQGDQGNVSTSTAALIQGKPVSLSFLQNADNDKKMIEGTSINQGKPIPVTLLKQVQDSSKQHNLLTNNYVSSGAKTIIANNKQGMVNTKPMAFSLIQTSNNKSADGQRKALMLSPSGGLVSTTQHLPIIQSNAMGQVQLVTTPRMSSVTSLLTNQHNVVSHALSVASGGSEKIANSNLNPQIVTVSNSNTLNNSNRLISGNSLLQTNAVAASFNQASNPPLLQRLQMLDNSLNVAGNSSNTRNVTKTTFSQMPKSSAPAKLLLTKPGGNSKNNETIAQLIQSSGKQHTLIGGKPVYLAGKQALIGGKPIQLSGKPLQLIGKGGQIIGLQGQSGLVPALNIVSQVTSSSSIAAAPIDTVNKLSSSGTITATSQQSKFFTQTPSGLVVTQLPTNNKLVPPTQPQVISASQAGLLGTQIYVQPSQSQAKIVSTQVFTAGGRPTLLAKSSGNLGAQNIQVVKTMLPHSSNKPGETTHLVLAQQGGQTVTLSQNQLIQAGVRQLQGVAGRGKSGPVYARIITPSSNLRLAAVRQAQVASMANLQSVGVLQAVGQLPSETTHLLTQIPVTCNSLNNYVNEVKDSYPNNDSM